MNKLYETKNQSHIISRTKKNKLIAFEPSLGHSNWSQNGMAKTQHLIQNIQIHLKIWSKIFQVYAIFLFLAVSQKFNISPIGISIQILNMYQK